MRCLFAASSLFFDSAKRLESKPLLDPHRSVSDLEAQVVVLDATCPYTGGMLVGLLRERGVEVATVFSEYAAWGLSAMGHDPPSELVAPPPGRETEWSSIPLCVLSESDGGLAAAERIGYTISATFSNSIDPTRRDKYLLHERLKERNLPHCRQILCEDPPSNFELPCVVKPSRGVGSEGVFVCRDVERLNEAFRQLKGTARLGSDARNTLLLVQQFLDGPEYAVDSVSRFGHHKICAVWKYEKRGVVYLATRLVECDDRICDAVTRALDAVEYKNGPAHTEVIVDDVPTVVEINCRFHNADVPPLVAATGGVDAVTATAAALADVDEWNRIPDRPRLNGMHATLLHLNVDDDSSSGILRRFREDNLAKIRDLPSVLKAHVYPSHSTPGSFLSKTVDIKTDAGYVLLVHSSLKQIEDDTHRIRTLLPLFECE